MLPGVPNTTHVTQATDRNYWYFKLMHSKNLKDLVEYRRLHKLQVQLADISFLVFGKRFGWTKHVVLENAFDNAFFVEKSKAVWSKIGTIYLAPLDLHHDWASGYKIWNPL